MIVDHHLPLSHVRDHVQIRQTMDILSDSRRCLKSTLLCTVKVVRRCQSIPVQNKAEALDAKLSQSSVRTSQAQL